MTNARVKGKNKWWQEGEGVSCFRNLSFITHVEKEGVFCLLFLILLFPLLYSVWVPYACVILKLSDIICNLLSFTLEFFTNKIKIPDRYDYLILKKIIWFWLFPPTSFGWLQITLSICDIPFWRAGSINAIWWILYKLLLTVRLLDQGLYFGLWSYIDYCLEMSLLKRKKE